MIPTGKSLKSPTVNDDAILEAIEALEGSFSESTLLPGDRGGWTQGGISSRSYPQLSKQLRAGTLSEDTIRAIYRDDFIEPLVKSVPFKNPSLVTLLILGRVHGSGFQHYLSAIADYLEVQPSLTDEELFARLEQDIAVFQDLRTVSVGIPNLDKGIRNRVKKEFELAKGLGNQYIIQEGTLMRMIVINSKLRIWLKV